MRQIELLAPAGSYETFLAVLAAGADAVYAGGNAFGARAYANNFTEEELLKAIDYAHIHGRKLYLTVNTLFKEKELTEQLYPYLLPYYKQGLDAVIVQDIGAMQFIREHFPGLEIHTSTQMTVTNRYGAQMMKDLGASRVVTAREMSFAEIEDIHKHVDVEIESFVHGALCYCFSGQCLLSSIIGGRSGNRGRCAQPCRLPYEAYEMSEKGKMNCISDKKKPFLLSPKDLCTIHMIPQLVRAGIYSFKIEGRMKQAEYAAGVVSIYRKYIDMYLEKGEAGFQVSQKDYQRLLDLGNRSGFTEGYYKKHNGADMITFEQPSHKKGDDFPCEITEIKEKIKGTLRLNKELPAIMTVAFGDTEVTVTGDIVSEAIKQPLSPEKVRENAEKTGNTPFVFESLEIEMDEGIFMPVKAINQLRREALEQLEALFTEQYRRTEPSTREKTDRQTETLQKENDGNQKKPILTASIEKRSQLNPLLQSERMEAIYLDSTCYARKNLLTELKSDCSRIKAAGKEAYLILPAVFRKHTSDFYREIMGELQQTGLAGFVVKSYDSLRFVKEVAPDGKIITDQSLYTYNNYASGVLGNYQPERITAPFELNKKELQHRFNENSELVIYGRIPLMTSAQCIRRSTGGCKKESGVLFLKDRYEKIFVVKNNCEECYNVLYNSLPTALFKVLDETDRMYFAAYRLAFTTESEKEVNEIIGLYEDSRTVFEKEFTYGHYKRGVE